MGNVENQVKHTPRGLSGVILNPLESSSLCGASWSRQTKGEGCGGTPQSPLWCCAGFQSGSSGTRPIFHTLLCAHPFHTSLTRWKDRWPLPAPPALGCLPQRCWGRRGLIIFLVSQERGCVGATRQQKRIISSFSLCDLGEEFQDYG